MMRAVSNRHVGKLFLTVSVAAVASSAAFAASYTAGSDAELRAAINAANASADASSTITLTGNFAISTVVLPVPTKAITIDTAGFTLGGPPGANNSGAPQFRNLSGGTITLLGNYVGGTGTAGANTTGGFGLYLLANGGNPIVINNGSVAGGVGFSPNGRGGTNQVQNATLINNGTALGGEGRGALQGGNGLSMSNSSLINTGLIQGGSSTTANGGAGVQAIGGTTNSFINTGTIRGGTGVVASVLASGVLYGTGFELFDNQGTIEGGTGGSGIWNGTSIKAINSGTIRAGAGQANAIMTGNGVGHSLDLTLKAGSVIAGNVTGSSAGTSDILRLAGDVNWTLDGGIGSAGQYRNFDTLEKSGASSWAIGTGGDFAGQINVLMGRLAVNGALPNAIVTVSGGTLAGSGTVGATTVAAGGTIAPGNSIGTLAINGAFTQAAGSTYQIELDPGTATSDRIAVSGTATLASGANLSVVNYTGAPYGVGQRYTILTSTGGLTGTYGYNQPVTAFFNLRDSYDANNAYLTVTRNATSVGSVGGTPNETQVGNSVDSLPTGNSILDGLLNQANLANARGALNQLSGEVHASARTALIDESWIIRNAVNDRLRAAFGGVGAPSVVTMNYGYTADLARSVKGPIPALPADRFALWGQGFGSWGRTSSDGNASTMSRSTGGFLLGGDVAAFDNLRFGVLAGYSRSNFDVKARASSGESDNYHLGLYGGGQWGALSLRTGASYTWHDVSTSRLVTAAYLGGNPRADYDAATAQVFGEVGYRMGVGGIELEPFAGLAYVNLHTGRFAETGAMTALLASGDDTGVGYSTLGLRASTMLAFGGADLTLRGGLAWRHAFGDVKPSATMAFAGSTPFTISGLPIARDAAVIEAGADMAIGRNVTLGLAYNGQLGQDTQDHSFKGVLAVKF